jgi:hypothetical protein
MAETYQVIGLNATGDRVIDTLVEDVTGEGPDFYAFKALHADGVVCAEILPLGAPGSTVTALVVKCDPGVDLDDVLEAGL